jgi:ubiquinone/menaquinone biosynthesis C-methylase UbiE
MTDSPEGLRHRAARRAAALAFGPAARLYALLTGHEAWRRNACALASLVPGPRVLDLGIGPGTGAIEWAQGDGSRIPLGLDSSAAMLRRASAAARRAGLRLPLVQACATALPLRTGTLDGATGHSLLYLLPDPAKALHELHRAVRPGGRVAFLEPRGGPLPWRGLATIDPRVAASMLLWRTMSRLHRRFDEGSLSTLLTEAGFTEVRAWPVLGGFGVMACALRPAVK